MMNRVKNLLVWTALWAGLTNLAAAEPNPFQDTNFERGFRVVGIPQPLAEAVDFGQISFAANPANGSDETPFWTLSTHYSKFDITRATRTTGDDGSVFFHTPGQIVSLRWAENETLLRLDVLADAEYDRPRQKNDPWPHLLINRNFDPNDFLSPAKGPILFSFDVRIGSCENRMTPEQYDSNLHCAQSNAYFIIRNVNAHSPDFNDYIWFGVPVFDSRHKIVAPYTAIDGDPNIIGTGKLICTFGGDDAYRKIYGDKNPADGLWCHGALDLSAEARAALAAAQDRGLLLHTTLDDLALVHFNFGWEVPGIFRCSMEIKNLSLRQISDTEK